MRHGRVSGPDAPSVPEWPGPSVSEHPASRTPYTRSHSYVLGARRDAGRAAGAEAEENKVTHRPSRLPCHFQPSDRRSMRLSRTRLSEGFLLGDAQMRITSPALKKVFVMLPRSSCEVPTHSAA